MWNERYNTDEFVYGTEPNRFLRENAHVLRGPVLSLAEGEGRNAVFLAGLGLDVTAVDLADVGLAKAVRLAASCGVKIHCVHADLAHYDPGVETFNAVISIFAHVPSEIRRALHRRVIRCLKPGGRFLLEAYTPAQIPRGTGGPKDPDLCMNVRELMADLPGFTFEIAHEIDREVIEGKLHNGVASVVQILALKPAGNGDRDERA